MDVAPIPDPLDPDHRYILQGDDSEVGELVLTHEGDDGDTWTLSLPSVGLFHEIPAAKGRPPIASAVGYAQVYLEGEG